MFEKVKRVIKRYDNWCESMGLTPDQKRCCVPVKPEDLVEKNMREEKKESE